ncbi:hypothetical protein ACQEVS_33065 [Streptomyces sp. CA-181903]|uniref:hypothetical protein n=1 Tax=Streptomyces sp. CA-181903 TaxID=3240055 RepID=UPI003D8DB1DA
MGCGLEITTGRDYGTAIIRVSTRNALAAVIPYPRKLRRKSINAGLTFGKFKDSSKATTDLLRFHCGLVIGQPEGGKTNLLNVINAELAQCSDVLLWHIDVTGAGVTLPWLRSWARDGSAIAPVVDWAASTVDEALVMLQVAEEIIAVRKREYQDRMFDADDDKIPVDDSVPEIIIVADEVAQLPLSVQKGLDTVINTGRASGVRAVNCALRATREMASPAMKEMTRLRIAMRVSDESEYQHIFSDFRGLKKEDAPYKGSGFIELGTEKARPFKAYRLKPKRISGISQEVALFRPRLDEVSLKIPSVQFYRERWARTLPLLYTDTNVLSAAAKKILDTTTPAPTPTPTPSENNGIPGLDLDALFPTRRKSPYHRPPPPPSPSKAPTPLPPRKRRPSEWSSKRCWTTPPPRNRPRPRPSRPNGRPWPPYRPPPWPSPTPTAARPGSSSTRPARTASASAPWNAR